METVSLITLPEHLFKLVLAAIEARKSAYAPYSKFQVGAAVLDENKNIHTGCNVEDIAWNVTHAERGAINRMFVKGGKRITAIVVATKNGGPPCGDCRQHISEFCGSDPNIPIFVVGEYMEIRKTTIGELLPYVFTFEPSE